MMLIQLIYWTLVVLTGGAGASTVTFGHAGFYLEKIMNTELFSNHWLHTIKIQRPMFNFNLLQQQMPPDTHQIAGILITSYKRMFDEPSSRSKRELFDHGIFPFIGWLQSKITGVATLGDLDDLKVSTVSLSKYIEKLREAFLDQSKVISTMLGDMTKLDTLTRELTVKQNLVIDEIEKLANRINSVDEEIRSYVSFSRNFDRFQVLLNFYIHNFIIAQMTYAGALSECRRGYIPREAIPKNDLRKIIHDIEIKASLFNLTLSVDPKNLEYYYNIDIVHCITTSEEIELVIAFPVTQIEQLDYTIYHIKPIPIMLENSTYLLEGIHDGLIVVSSTEVHSILEYKTYCLSSVAFNLEGCLINPVVLRAESPTSCLRQLIAGGSIHDYKEKCKLVPQPELIGEWIQINSTSWIYSGVKRNVSIKCEVETVSLEIGGPLSSVIVTLPCNCFLFDKTNRIIVSPTSMCAEASKIQIIDLTSFFALPTDYMIFKQPTVISDIKINKNLIPTTLPNETMNFISEKAELKRIQKFLESEKVPQIDWTSSYTSWWGWVINIVIIISLVVIAFLVLRRFLSSKSTILPLVNMIPGVRAEPGFVILTTIDLLSLIVIAVILYMIIKMISRILKKFRCHHLRTQSLGKNSMNHLDIVFEYKSEIVIIGILDLPLPLDSYQVTSKIGKITIKNGLCILSNFGELNFDGQFPLNINSTYKIKSSLLIENMNAYIKTSKDISQII